VKNSGSSWAAILILGPWCSGSLAGPPAQSQQPASLILTGGAIRTPTGTVGALAVRHGIIVALGDTASVAAFRGPGTHVVDLAGSAVLPGLSDLHVHPLGAGLSETQCKIAQGSSLAATVTAVEKCAQKSKAEEWVVGGQWDAPALGGVPDREALDAVAANRP